MGDNRSFTLERSSFEPQGAARKSRYVHKFPRNAAKKAARVTFRRFPKRGNETLYLKLAETTSGSTKDVFFYKVDRVKSEASGKPKKFGDARVPVGYKYDVKSVDEDEFLQHIS